MRVSQEAAASTPPAFVTSALPPTKTDVLPTGTPGTPSTGPKAYFVSTTGNNADGRSWGTAWNGLNQVNWSIIQPGDTIYISGGPTGATYAGGIQISKNGTASAYITIDTGANSPSPAGHDGTVIFEGGRNCIRARGSYLKIRNLLCQHATDSGFRIQGKGIILENNTIRETYGQGIHVQYCTGCIVRGNRVTTFPNDGPGENRPYQTDGIVAYESSDTLIERNWIKLTNQYGPAHIDGIQASTQLGANHENITIQYNYVENTKNMMSNSQGIYLTQMQGNVRIVGNVVNHPNGNETVVSYLPNTVGSPVNVFVVGNTIKCAGYRCLLVGDDDPVIKNNIIWHTGSNQLVDLRDNTSCNPANITNNLYYAPNSSYPFAGNCGRTWSEWHNSKNLDTNGIFGLNPNLDSCFRPTGASPAVGKGTILADEYNQGLASSLCGQNGPGAFLPVILNNRNQQGGSGWDIGAYELP
jgi:parallel beta-helix repeat protein